MASKSGQAEPEKAEVIEEQLDALDSTLDRVKVLYEQYFLGIQKQPPSYLHTDIERKIRDLAQLQIRNTALRYRYSTLQQKFGSYNTYWRRTLRQIENGTYARNLSKIGRQAARTGAAVPAEILAAMPKRMRDQVQRDREAALALAKLRERPEVEEELLTLADEDVEIDVDDLDPAAFVGEPSELRRNVLTAGGAHQINESDADFDLDAFFANVVREEEPAQPAAAARGARRSTGHPRRKTPSLPRLTESDDETTDVMPRVTPPHGVPAQPAPAVAATPPRVVPGGRSATPPMGSRTTPRPPGIVAPGATPPAGSPASPRGGPAASSGGWPAVPPEIKPGPRAQVAGLGAPPPGASPSSPAQEPVRGASPPGTATPPGAAGPGRAASVPAIPSVPGAPPRPVGKPAGVAPSQATRPLLVIPGSAARSTATVETMAGPFPRIPSPPTSRPRPTPSDDDARVPLPGVSAEPVARTPHRRASTASDRHPTPDEARPATARTGTGERAARSRTTTSERAVVGDAPARSRTTTSERAAAARAGEAPARGRTTTAERAAAARAAGEAPARGRTTTSERAAAARAAGEVPRARTTTAERAAASRTTTAERAARAAAGDRTPAPERAATRPGLPRAPSARPVPEPRQAPPPGMSDADVNALYAKFVQAKQILGEEAGPGAYSKLLKTINAQAPKIMEQYKSKGVDFSVVVKNNQVIIRAKPKP